VQVFGGKFSYNTWWTEEPHQMYGINALPFTPASTYLGADPAYVRSVFALLPAEEKHYHEHGNIPSNPPPDDIWQDALANWLALADADLGLARWNKQGNVENGDTRTRTLYWLLSLKEMGSPDLTVTADTALYSVFRNASGARTYLAYNARATPLTVTFSDGKVLEVVPHAIARARYSLGRPRRRIRPSTVAGAGNRRLGTQFRHSARHAVHHAARMIHSMILRQQRGRQ